VGARYPLKWVSRYRERVVVSVNGFGKLGVGVGAQEWVVEVEDGR
jgi:hypothetical protein